MPNKGKFEHALPKKDFVPSRTCHYNKISIDQFFNCFLAAPRPTKDYFQGANTPVTAFCYSIFELKITSIGALPYNNARALSSTEHRMRSEPLIF